MPKGVGCASYKSFVFNEWRGDWSDGFYLIRGTWLTSAKSGGFRPVGLTRGQFWRYNSAVDISSKIVR